MPVIKSALKKMRQDAKRLQSNRLKKERLKKLIKIAQKEPAEKNVRLAISFVDKVAKVKLFHKKKASRIKSRLAKLLAKPRASASVKKKPILTSRRKTKTTTVKKISPKKPLKTF